MIKPWIFVVAAVVLAVAAWHAQGWAGVAMVLSTLLFLGMLQFHRALGVLRKAARNPVGRVPSAVMLNARLKPGMSLTQLVQLCGSLGRRVDGDDAAPEQRLAWSDPGEAEVVVRLRRQKVVDWTFTRPPAADAGTAGVPEVPAAPLDQNN